MDLPIPRPQPTPRATTEHAALQRISPITVDATELEEAPAASIPPTEKVRAWGPKRWVAGA